VTHVGSSRTRRLDPLGVQAELPLTGVFHPMGFRLDLTTNCLDVVEAAEESWPHGAQEFDAPPLTMRVFVTPQGDLAQPGTHRKTGHLYSVVSDRDNFAHVDLNAQFASVHVSRQTASDHTWLRWFFIESLAYLMLNQRHLVMLHAAFVAWNGTGTLLCGASTAGKSTLAYACARAGWTFLSDDCSALLPNSPDRFALGRPRQIRFRPDAPTLFPELDSFVARARPTGKIAIEVPTAALGLRTADGAPVGAIAFVERGPGAAYARPISADETIDRLLAEMPTYGEEVDRIHESAVIRIAAAPAFVLRYETLSQAIDVLSAL
jgi:hypothetical protein